MRVLTSIVRADSSFQRPARCAALLNVTGSSLCSRGRIFSRPAVGWIFLIFLAVMRRSISDGFFVMYGRRFSRSSGFPTWVMTAMAAVFFWPVSDPLLSPLNIDLSEMGLASDFMAKRRWDSFPLNRSFPDSICGTHWFSCSLTMDQRAKSMGLSTGCSSALRAMGTENGDGF